MDMNVYPTVRRQDLISALGEHGARADLVDAVAAALWGLSTDGESWRRTTFIIGPVD